MSFISCHLSAMGQRTELLKPALFWLCMMVSQTKFLLVGSLRTFESEFEGLK